GDGNAALLWIELEPHLATVLILRVDTQQVGEFAIESFVTGQSARDVVLFDEECEVVARLRKTIGDVFDGGGGARFELQAYGHAVELARVEIRASRGDGEIQAAARRQHAIARVEKNRACFAGFDGDADVQHVASRPERILDLDVERQQAAVRRLDVERGQIERDAVETRVHALPAIGKLADGFA